jgi:hypothetical protein
MSSPKNSTVKKKRCPKGTRKNKNGDCVPIKIARGQNIDNAVDDENSTSISPDELNNKMIVEELKKQLAQPAKRCPKGQRRVKGVCVDNPKVPPVMEAVTAAVPMEIVTELVTAAEMPVVPVAMTLAQMAPSATKPKLPPPPPSNINMESEEIKTMNKLLKKKELVEYRTASDEHPFLYPNLNDPNFNIKIASRKEFFDTQYDGTVYDIEKRADELCSYKFELAPHQLFVKNFLSFQTPYNSLLLYHSLGTGKTCSAIGVAEEMRNFMKQMGKEKILIVASPNLQGNFRKQLFDETALKKIVNPNNPEEYVWNIESCVGNTLLNEINPQISQNLPQDKIVSNINSIINQYYEFMGYGQLANFITDVLKVDTKSGYTEKEILAQEIKSIRRAFNNRLIIIDEVHNIRLTDENKDRAPVASLLMKVAKYSQNMRLLLLSATPMFNSYEEIIWLINLMSLNDKRSTIEMRDVFDSKGEFKTATGSREESGKDILTRKLTGYVSYVRGENPYVFPFRLYPKHFAPTNTFPALKYPTIQMNSKPIDSQLKHISVFVDTMPVTTFQYRTYKYLMEHMKQRTYDVFSKETGELIREMPSFENMDSFGYALLQLPLETLNMVYPSVALERAIKQYETKGPVGLGEQKDMVSIAVGEKGLSNVLTYEDIHMVRCHFEYKPEVVQKYGRIFSPEYLPNYSRKIHQICNTILKTKGIIIIYSQYIDGGIIPMCLALEEIGFARFGASSNTKNLFKTPPTVPLDSITLQPDSATTKQAKYVIISGDKYYSPNNKADMRYIVSPENKDGSTVKVVLISKTGTEGLDFKCVRQIHMMEPWYNMNRIEQIIGRGVRNLSHCMLPFKQRNVQIYMHSTLFDGSEEEAADLYVYRLAEKKALQIGRVTRLLKETSVDCLLNMGQTKFTTAELEKVEENKHIQLELSSGGTIDFQVGDQPFTDICDYMDSCEIKCSPTKDIDPSSLITSTYNSEFAKTNILYISNRIKQLFREQSVYKRDLLVASINVKKTLPLEQIFFTLTQFIQNKNNNLVDKYGRFGYLVNKDEYYVFQPIELTDENASVFERTVPVDYRRSHITMEVPKNISLFEQQQKQAETETAQLPPEKVVENVETIKPTQPPPPTDDVYAEATTIMYDTVMKKVIDKLNLTLSKQSTKKSVDWYMHFFDVTEHLKTVYSFTQDEIDKYVLHRTLDMLLYNEKLVLFKHLYSSSGGNYKISPKWELETKQYFQSRIMTNESRNKIGILVPNDETIELWMRSKTDTDAEWEQGDNHDYNLFVNDIQKYNVPLNSINQIVGFAAEFRKKEMVFKVKDLRQKRNNNGARIDNAGKADVIKLLNQIVGVERYTNENTEKEFSKIGLCVVLELVMRKYTDTKQQNKVFYLTPEQALVKNIARI